MRKFLLTGSRKVKLLDIYRTAYASKPYNFRLKSMPFPGIPQTSVNNKTRNYYKLNTEDTNIKNVSITEIGSFGLNVGKGLNMNKPYYTVHLKLKYNEEFYKAVTVDCTLENDSITINAEDTHLILTKKAGNTLTIQCLCCGWYSIYIEDIVGYDKTPVSVGTQLKEDTILVTENIIQQAASYFVEKEVYTGTGSDRVFHAGKYWYTHPDGGYLRYSTDGLTWATAGSQSFYCVLDIHYANGIYVLTSDEEGIFYSIDGLNWTATSVTDISRPGSFSTFIRNWIYYDYTQGLWVTMGYYSTDGKSWTACKKTDGSQCYFQSAYYANGIWVAVGNARHYYSTDGKVWTEVANTNPGKMYGWATHYANGVWVTAAYSSTNTNVQSWEGIYYSTNGKNWTQTLTSARGFVDVYFGDGVWVAITEKNGLYYSTDNAQTWTKANSGIDLSGLYYENGIWYANGYDNLISTNGTTWTGVSFGSSGRTESVYAMNGVWAIGSALGVNVVKFYSPTELEHYTKVQI